MEIQQIISLALLQGLTEFLPISSSAHLILLPLLAGWPDQGPAFDVAVHVGTLCAVAGYFRQEIVRMGRDAWASVVQRRLIGTAPLAWGVLIGTIPVVLAGGLLTQLGAEFLRAPEVIATSTVFFALVLWWADRRGARIRDEHTLGWRDVLIIGLAQALALIPGTSRAGITLTAGLALGLTRAAAARFSFLLAIPTIALAGAMTGIEALREPGAVDWEALLLGTVLAGVVAYSTIHWFLRLLDRVGLLPFILYRLLLGAVLFFFLA